MDSLIQLIKEKIPALKYDPVHSIYIQNLLIPISEEERNRDKELARQIKSEELWFGLKFHLDLIKLSPFYKHLSFAEEKEIRLAATFSDDNIDSKIRGSVLLPYTTFKLPMDTLKEIIIGPNPNWDQAEFGLKIFLKNQGLENVEIKHSKIPFRQ